MSIDPKKLKVAELRAALAERGLDTSGLKNDLIHRLQMKLDEEEFGLDDPPVADAPPDSAPVGEPAPEPAPEPAKAEPAPEAAAPAEDAAAPAPEATVPAAAALSEEEQRKKARAERFGIPYAPPEQPKPSKKAIAAAKAAVEEEKKRKREERFATSSLSAEDIAKREARKARFNL